MVLIMLSANIVQKNLDVLEQPIIVSDFPIHRTLANVLKKIPITEASVERAFSKHRLLHNPLRASLSEAKLDDQLIICYNFSHILKLVQTHSGVDEEIIEAKISLWKNSDA